MQTPQPMKKSEPVEFASPNTQLPKADKRSAKGNAKGGKSLPKKLSYEEKWLRVITKLEANVGSDVFASWFGRLKLDSVDGGVALHSVPTAFLKSWINSNYNDLLLELWQQEDDSILRIDITLRSAVRKHVVEKLAAEKPKPEIASKPNLRSSFDEVGITGGKAIPNRGLPNSYNFAGSPLDPKHTFKNFIEGQSNRVVYAAARSVAEDPNGSVRFNPLIIHSNVGRGKTHILQAIAWEAKTRDPKTRVLYLTAEYFMFLFASAIRDKTALKLKESLRGIDILLIDDMQFLQGKSIQAEFCHLLNELIDSARQVVVAADRPPTELESLNDRVRSRLKGGVTLEIDAPDYELRKEMLNSLYKAQQIEQPNLEIPEDILHYVARKVTTSGRDVDGAFSQLLLQHRFTDRNVTMEEIDKTLRHLIKTADSKRIRIEEIQRVVARQFNVSKQDLLSDRRNRTIVRPRQIAMYLAKMMTPRSLPEIGRRFGGRDHTTVLHAVRKIEQLSSEDNKMSQEIELLKRLILD